MASGLNQTYLGTKIVKKLLKKAYAKINCIAKMKYLGSSIEDLLYYYNTNVRSQLEYCAVVFHPGLTKCQTNKIENI